MMGSKFVSSNIIKTIVVQSLTTSKAISMLIYEMKSLIMQEHILTTLTSWVYHIETHFVFLSNLRK